MLERNRRIVTSIAMSCDLYHCNSRAIETIGS